MSRRRAPEFNIFGVIRERTGATLPGIAVSNTYG
jgi:hypothetical protein